MADYLLLAGGAIAAAIVLALWGGHTPNDDDR